MIMKNLLNEFSLRTNTFHMVSQMKSANHWCNWKAICLLLMVFGGRSVVGQVVLSSGSMSYNQDFNSLSGTGTTIAWSNNSNIPGWYLINTSSGNDITNYTVGTGSGTSGSIYSFGSSSSSERSLGSLCSNSFSSYIVLSFENSTGLNISSFVLNYNGEQWRNGGNTSSQNLTVQYGFGSSYANVSSWTNAPSNFTFTSPIATSTAAAVNGNVAGKVTGLGGEISSLNWDNGSILFIRWIDLNDTGNDHGLAIDDVSFSASTNGLTTVTNLNIPTGTTLTVPNGSQLTVNGILTNNGTLTIESGATFLQGPSSSLAGTGTYNVKQFVTGAGGTTPTDRFWYMGVPINGLNRGAAFGTASGSNRLWSWSESDQVWSSQLGNTEALTPTTGYSFRTGSDVTLNFSGTSLYSADPSISGLTNTTGSFSGCHLMSNPFTAYADWEQIYTASANISSTYCVRSFNTGNSQMVYDTYNATGDVAVSNSTIAVTRYIAPMQSFWIIVNPSTTGTFNMTKAMLSHQPSATGLKDLSTFNAFARLNLIGGNLSDQVVVYMTPDATNGMDAYDSKKMMLSNVPQVYTTLGNDKLVINGLKESKAHTIVPLTLQLPTSQTYHFEMAESNVNYGLVILEDREELVFQDMTANPDYAFFAQAGISSDRFVLHFHFPLNTASTDEIGSSAQIDIVSNNTGAVNVQLSEDLQVGGEITVLDQSGRLVAKKTITQAQTLVQINETAGVYFVRVQTPGKTEMKKVVLY